MRSGSLPRERLLRLRRLGGLDGHPDVARARDRGELRLARAWASPRGAGSRSRSARLGRAGRVVVMTGDGELQEGQNWEALQSAAHERLGALWVVVDRNEVQSDKRTEEIVALGDLEAKFRAFGWHVETVDGHDHAALRAAFARFPRRRRRAEGARRAEPSRARASRSWSIRVALADGGGTYRWHAGAPADEPFARALAELEARPRRAVRRARARAARARGRRARGAWLAASRASPSREPAARAGARAATRRVRRRGVRRDAARAGGGARRPRRPRRRPRLRLPRPRLRARLSRTASSSAGSPSRTWSRRPPGWRATGCCPSSTRSRPSSPSRANEQIYNQASEGSKVVYALHYAGLIPAGPGKSHQSMRDISLLAALPNVAIVQPASSEETARARSLGRRGGRGERRAPARDRPVAAADRAARAARRRSGAAASCGREATRSCSRTGR